MWQLPPEYRHRYLSKPDMHRIFSIPFWSYARLQEIRENADDLIIEQIKKRAVKEQNNWEMDGRDYIRIDGPMSKTSDSEKGLIFFAIDYLLLLSDPRQARATECVHPGSISSVVFDNFIYDHDMCWEPIHDAVLLKEFHIKPSAETLLYWQRRGH